MTASLTLDDVHVTLAGRSVLSGLHLELAPGQVRGLIGFNGAGKTTALRAALGMLRPDRGRVLLRGHDIWLSERTIWAGVGHLVETASIYPELTAWQNIADSARLHGADCARSSASALERAVTLADALGIADRLHTPTHRLSLGSRQKVGLISALAHDPELVILDEPTNGLDPLAVVALRTELLRLADCGSAILLTSHHFDELARVAGQVDILHGGRILRSITPDGTDLESRFFDAVLADEHTARGNTQAAAVGQQSGGRRA